ncbi:hypothetical protein V5O48_005211 [Marasmius crinis-equi]|uniref:Uncharacterized protein n=1 Tax=Marasmius crinis-equi TaxID=585013 RepID=A0ABR3FN66_9AGAR
MELKQGKERRKKERESQDMKSVSFPKDLDNALAATFRSVKCELYPLDGLIWTEEQVATQSRCLTPSEDHPGVSNSQISSTTSGTPSRCYPEPGMLRSPPSSPNAARRRSKENATVNSARIISRMRPRTVSITPTIYADITNNAEVAHSYRCDKDGFYLVDEDDLKTPTAYVPDSWPKEPEDDGAFPLVEAIIREQEVREIDIEFLSDAKSLNDEPKGLPMGEKAGSQTPSAEQPDPFGFGTTPESFKIRRDNFGWVDRCVGNGLADRSWVA